MAKNVFVLGIDDFNLEQLEAIRNADRYRFQALFGFDEVKGGGRYPFDELLAGAQERLNRFDGPIDAICGYWDFPVTSIVPILCRQYGTPGPSVESVAKCEHKYWSRREQAKAVPELAPRYSAVNPFVDDPLAGVELDFPFWLKPVKGTDSLLGFKIRHERDFRNAIDIIRENIGHITGPFDRFLSHVQLPEDIAHVDGSYCIAEELMSGRQCTVSGYVHRGEVTVYGVVDSVNYPKSSSFFRYQYPSHLPKRVKERLAAGSKRIMEHIGYDQAAFNIEYFYDERHDRISLLEINPRISQSHGHLYQQVDGSPNHQIMVELALGRRPEFPYREGGYGVAAEFHLRRFEDAVVTRIPSGEEVREIEQNIPGTIIDIKVDRCTHLSEMIEQDSYSFDIAHVFMGARDQHQLLENYRRCVDSLRFEFADQDC